jgi:NADH-quinone oxidoreductase subunit E
MTAELQLTGHRDQLFSEAIRQQLDSWISKYPPGQAQSAVIPALHILQDAHEGWVSEGVMRALAEYLDIPVISVFEVATFYTMFELKPVGQHKISLCTNISCQLCGSEDIANHIQKKLGVGFGQTTADGKFTLKEVECLGACVGAPMLLLDREYHEHLTVEKIDTLLDGVK